MNIASSQLFHLDKLSFLCIIKNYLGVWQSSNDNWKHICSKMYLSNNYVDINIYPLTMNVMHLWACLYGKGAISNDNIIIILLLLLLLYYVGNTKSWTCFLQEFTNANFISMIFTKIPIESKPHFSNKALGVSGLGITACRAQTVPPFASCNDTAFANDHDTGG